MKEMPLPAEEVFAGVIHGQKAHEKQQSSRSLLPLTLQFASGAPFWQNPKGRHWQRRNEVIIALPPL